MRFVLWVHLGSFVSRIVVSLALALSLGFFADSSTYLSLRFSCLFFALAASHLNPTPDLRLPPRYSNWSLSRPCHVARMC